MVIPTRLDLRSAIPGPCFLCLAAALMTCSTLFAADRPHILWLTAEDIGPHLGCYGDPVARTPELDELARRSLTFDVAWSNHPVCAPARTTIITGVYPASTGGEHMRSDTRWPEDLPFFPQLLRQAGYYCTNNQKEDYNHPPPGQVWDASSGRAHWNQRADHQPFFAVFNFTGTHESRIRSRPHDMRTDPGSVQLPDYHPDTPEVRRDWAQYYDNIATLDAWVEDHLRQLDAAGLTKDTIVVFFGDHGSGMPRHKRFPGDSGLHVPLIVHVPDKFRDLAPDDYQPGMHTRRLVGFIDLAPSMLQLAGVDPPAHLHGRRFLGRQRDPAARYLFGYRGRMDERADLVRSARDDNFVYLRNYLPHRPHGQLLSYQLETPTTRIWKLLFDRGLLRESQQAFWQPRAAEELYDLTTDPQETLNLAGHPEFAAVIERFRGVLREQTLKIRDTGFIPEPELVRISAHEDIYSYARDTQRYPLADILEVADLATRGELPSQSLVAAATAEHPSLRYWSAVGWLTQGPSPAGRNKDMAVSLLDDPSAAVRIAAAEAVAKSLTGSEREAAVQKLLQLCDLRQTDYYTSVAAFDALDQLGPATPEVIRRLEQLPTGPGPARGGDYLVRLLNHLRRNAQPPAVEQAPPTAGERLPDTSAAETGATIGSTEQEPATETRREVARSQPMADFILTGARIWTADPGHPTAEALAVLEDRIVAVGSEAEVDAWRGPRTQVLHAGGRLVLPGFNDAHLHFVDGGRQLDNVDLKLAGSPEEFGRRLADYGRDLPDGEWIVGGNWDDQRWSPHRLPTREDIDRWVPDRPVFVSRYDGHMGVANSLALRLAGIDAGTETPVGGDLERDADGQPTGLLKDAAMGLVQKVIPPLTPSQRGRAIRRAMQHAAEWGVTSVQDMSCSYADMAAYAEMDAAGQLTTRIYAAPLETQWQDLARLGLRRAFGTPFYRLGALKGFADGSLGSSTAYFFDPYSDDPDNRGLLSDEMHPRPEFLSRLTRADAAGLQLCLHAIGDQAVSETLSVFAEVAAANGPGDRRFRIEHAQHLAPGDFARFRDVQVIASVQPYHAIDDGRWAELRIGPRRAQTTYAFRSFLDANVRLAIGTDWSVAPLNPLLTIYAAVTRATLDGRRNEGWVPEQKLTVAETVAAYTWGSAYAEFQEHVKGALTPGKFADLVVLERDIFTIPPREIQDVRVDLTMVGGRIVWQRPSAAP